MQNPSQYLAELAEMSAEQLVADITLAATVAQNPGARYGTVPSVRCKAQIAAVTAMLAYRLNEVPAKPQPQDGSVVISWPDGFDPAEFDLEQLTKAVTETGVFQEVEPCLVDGGIQVHFEALLDPLHDELWQLLTEIVAKRLARQYGFDGDIIRYQLTVVRG